MSKISWQSGGITVSDKAIRLWCLKFGPGYARTLKQHQGWLGDTWHADELFVTIRGHHLLGAANYRMFRARAFVSWRQVSGAR